MTPEPFESKAFYSYFYCCSCTNTSNWPEKVERRRKRAGLRCSPFFKSCPSHSVLGLVPPINITKGHGQQKHRPRCGIDRPTSSILALRLPHLCLQQGLIPPASCQHFLRPQDATCLQGHFQWEELEGATWACCLQEHEDRSAPPVAEPCMRACQAGSQHRLPGALSAAPDTAQEGTRAALFTAWT